MDSQASNWSIGTTDRSQRTWIDYSNGQGTWLDGSMHPFVGQQDDDDFDKVEIELMDVALTKRIAATLDDNLNPTVLVPDSSTLASKDVVNISGYQDLEDGSKTTLKYEMNKKDVEVTRGSKILTVITVYNEGPVDALIKQISDYVPKGLTFLETESLALNDASQVDFIYSPSTRRLQIWLDDGNDYEAKKLTGIENYNYTDCDKYEIKLVFEVDDEANGRMYNSAAITNYGYYGADGVYYSAAVNNVDRDSVSGVTASSLTNHHKVKYTSFADLMMEDMSNIAKDNLEVEDDDDVDVITVIERPEFDLSLRKYIYQIVKNYEVGGNPVTYTQEGRVPLVNNESIIELEKNQTAEYYHEKLKIKVEKGNLVKYRMRVYNEGTGRDYEGRATQITDYLPKGLEFVRIDDGYTTDWEYDTSESTHSKVVINYTGNQILPVDCIKKLADTSIQNPEQYYQEVGIVCRVTAESDGDNALNEIPLTNRAAITEREAYENGVIVPDAVDRDNLPQNTYLNPDSLEGWYYQELGDEGTPRNYIPGEEDDDDFDTVYVSGYTVNLEKVDGEGNLLPGVKLKAYKYRHIAYPTIQDEQAEELEELEDSVTATGTGSYNSSAPTTGAEHDVYIIKEIQTVNGYYNPFAGKYIKFSVRGDLDGIIFNSVIMDYNMLYFEIYEDNGNDDYTDDNRINYDHRKQDNIYNYVSFDCVNNEVTVKIKNIEEEYAGKYTVKLIKYGLKEDNELVQLGGVQFDSTGKFNGGSTVAIPRTGEKLESSATESVTVLPDSMTSGFVDITPDAVNTPDEIALKETGIKEGAVDEDGNPVDTEFYTGLLNKTLKLQINKTSNSVRNRTQYYVDTVNATLDGEAIGNSYTLENGSRIVIEKINEDPQVTTDGEYIGPGNVVINVRIMNPHIDKGGKYNLNLVKYKVGETTPVAGVHFTASAHINGANETIATASNPITTGTAATKIKENLEIDEDYINDNDTYTFTELDVGTNEDIYLGLTSPINLTVEKTIDKTDPSNWVFKVNKVSMTIGSTTVVADSDGETINVDTTKGIKATIKFNSTTQTIELSVTDPVKEGSFKINLIKRNYNVDEDNDGKDDPLQGAVFNITVNDGTRDIKTVINQTTNANGEIPTISGIDITAEDLTYKITVTEVSAPTGYIGIGAPVEFNAKSKFDGSKYVLDTSTQPTIENNYVQADVKEDEILIEAENRVEPVIHKGVKTVENQDSGYDKNEIQTWVINTSIPKGIKDYTVYNVTDTIDPENTDNNKKRIAFINEDDPKSNVEVRYKGENTTLTEGKDYQVTFDKNTKQLKVTFINATEGPDYFDGGRFLTQETILEIKYKTQFVLDKNGDPIGLNQRIPNKATLEYNGNGVGENKTKESEEPEVHTGGLGVYKYDKETNQALQGAKFRLVRTKEEAKAAVEALWAENQEAINAIDWVKKYNADGTVGDAWEVTTGADGYAYFAGLEFGEDAEKEGASPKNEGKNGAPIYNYDWTTAQTTYYLVETYVPEDYVLLEDVAAECVVKKDSFVKTDVTKYHKVGNELVVPEGEYGLEIVKYGKYEDEDPHPISGVVFSAKRKINGLAEEDLGNLTGTDSTGRTLIGDVVTIDKDKVLTDDEYTIHEESIPETSEYYVGLEKDIKLTVSKQSVKSEDKKKWLNSVTGINMTIEGENVTEVVAGKEYTATVTKDGQELEVKAELLEDEEGGQYIKLTVEDPHKVGDFKLNIIKTIKGTNPEKSLTGAGFKVSIKNGNEALVDGNGKILDGTNEFIVNDNGELVFEDLNIKKPGLTYDVEIEESTVPTGYIGISDKVKFSAVSKVKGAKLGLEDKPDTKISNDVAIKIEEDEIWVDVENKPEPVIHKGVRTIRNQDAGYDGDEIQTWVINSSIEAGIEDYTQYIITDEIDYEKTDVNEKRIEYIPGSIKVSVLDDYEGNKVKDLVENTDYEVNFDEEKKIITVTFINVDENGNGFKATENLTAGNIIEIKYNTKFRLDENGLIIGLQQSIKNEATLTFGVKNNENRQKKSETPEVHTGAVGVLKYEDVNKNGEFDEEDKVLKDAHFKIVRTKEEADKALAAVLAGDEETLKTINFVKTRDEEGNETDVDVELITGEDGTAVYQGLEFGKNASDNEENRGPNGKNGFEVYGYDWQTAKTEYYLVETEAPYDYYLLDRYEIFEVSKNSFVMLDLTTYYKEANKPKIYDLSLRKFITHVNGTDVEGNEIDKNITDRIPQVTLTDEFKDKENDEVTTAIYEHTKEPVIVQQGNTVTYTIRVYNEGPEDAYASLVKDDIPDGVEFIPYTEGDGSVNDEYRWKLVDENDNEVSDMSKAKYIITDYLSMEQGEVKDGVNSNLLKGYDSDTMKELDYRDLKVQFYVTEPNTSERIITNYAQITEMTNSDGKIETDRDSTPNEWIEGEDDQDVEHIRLLYFDLALRKWVTKAIVTSDGEEKVFETGHKAEDDPEDVVKVDLKKSKLDKVVVKFEYQIRITNEGRIGGWCEEITDHIPDGLTFDQADNPIWTVVDDKTIVTDALKDTYLEPGESAEVTVVLRWENSGDNLGIKVNIAEISKDRNEYGVHDIDSTPGNYKWGEDDIDDAPVMLAVTTGNMVIGYTILGLVVVSIITVGAIAIKKVRSEEDYF